MIPRNEDWVYRELTAAYLATFWNLLIKNKKQKLYSFGNTNLVPNKCNFRILLPALPKYLNKQ